MREQKTDMLPFNENFFYFQVQNEQRHKVNKTFKQDTPSILNFKDL